MNRFKCPYCFETFEQREWEIQTRNSYKSVLLQEEDGEQIYYICPGSDCYLQVSVEELI
jgi:hypothetical protein